ncbi:MAG: hypothetical protein ACKOZY_10020 [Flavobacteriales bacterium]
MAKKVNYLVLIRQRMEGIRKEYTALKEAYAMLEVAASVRGRKVTLPNLDDAMEAPIKPGRPAKAKEKYTGPKRSPGRPKKVTTKAATPAKTKKVAKAVKAEKPAKTKKLVAPKLKPGKKRTRIPNLAGHIQELVAKHGRFTTNAQITDKLAVMYPGKSRPELGKYISVILANMKSRKELAVVTVDAKGNKMRSGLWGLTTWFDGNKPKAEFLK